MNNIQQKFIFLSQIINIPVIDSATGKTLARTADFVAGLKEMYPKVSALVACDIKRRTKLYIPWRNVKMIVEEEGIFIENTADALQQSMQISESEILLKETFWDKQIVDINGSKVVRVNDLHLLREGLGLWVVHMDIGMTGLIRRLGWLRHFQFLVKLISSVELKDRFISWKYVQPVTSSLGQEALSLKAYHSKLADLHPADLADVLIGLGTEERITIIRSLDNVTAALTLQSLPLKIRAQIAESIEQKQLLDIINEMAMDEVADLLSQLAKKKVNALFSRLPQEKVSRISELLGHSSDIAGSIMNTEFITAKHNEVASAVLERIKKGPIKKESIYYIFVLDDNDILIGTVSLQQLLTALPERIISEFMRKRFPKVKVDTNIKKVAEVFYKYDFTLIPVVDKTGKIQGVITMKDAFENVFHEIRKEAEVAK